LLPSFDYKGGDASAIPLMESRFGIRYNYEALKELSQVDQLDISDDEDKAATLQDGRRGDEERIHFIRKPVEIKEFIQKVTKELQRESVGLVQIGCYKEIEYKQIEQQQHQ
jgi:hypothetical protein